MANALDTTHSISTERYRFMYPLFGELLLLYIYFIAEVPA